jgi:hypothetical protein
LNYFAWAVFVPHINTKYHNNSNSLVAKTKEVKGSIGRDIMVRAYCTYKQLRSKIEAVVEADSDFLE